MFMPLLQLVRLSFLTLKKKGKEGLKKHFQNIETEKEPINALYIPKPPGEQPSANAVQTERTAPYVPDLLVSSHIGGGEWGHKHGVTQGLVTGGVDHVSQRLL